jgi:L,D-peptidoglycan transpeptidase YkuD (ErfK/YbiS/YcfS/YnhG family)
VNPTDLVLTRRGVRFQNRYFPCTIGRGGIRTNKAEGDGATPRATLHITGMLYRPDRMTKPAPWAAPIRPGDLWSDASTHADYNQLVRTPYPHSHESLCRADPLYDLILLTDWNWPIATPGKGSAIFLHQWRRPGYATEGCIAFARAHLHQIAARIAPGAAIIIR